MLKGSSGFRQLLPVLLLITSGGVVWLFQKSAVAPHDSSNSHDGWMSKDEAESLRNENKNFSLQLKQAKEELQSLETYLTYLVRSEKSLADANSKLVNAQVKLDRTKELLPLDANGTCGAPSARQDHGSNNMVYCADSPLHLGRTKDFAECQMACAFNSSCDAWQLKRAMYLRAGADLSPQEPFKVLCCLGLACNFPLCCQQARRPDISALQVPAAPHGRCLTWGTPEKHVNLGGFWTPESYEIVPYPNPLQLLGAIKGNKTKHWNPELWDFRERHRIVIVAMVRDPLSQLQSWRKAPYGMERCAKRKRCPFSTATADCASKTAWLTEPCQFFEAVSGPPGTGIVGGAFRSLPGIWNAYTWGYVRTAGLQEESGYKSVVLVRFEDLVTEPAGVIRRTACVHPGACWYVMISLAMEMTMKDAAISVMEGVAKHHGKAKNRSTEIRSLESRDFVKDYSLPDTELQDRRSLTRVRLNFSLAQKVGYSLQECQVFKDEVIAEAPIDEDHKRIEIEEKMSRFRSRHTRPPRTSKVLRPRRKTTGK
eukprot:s168_g27.t1